MSPTHDQFIAELERLGVGEVRERIATKVYLGGLRDIAQGWVDRKSEASSAEQLALTRRTMAEAQKANKIAIAAIVIAAISMMMAVVGVIVSVIALHSIP
jgi:hypothetical protein